MTDLADLQKAMAAAILGGPVPQELAAQIAPGALGASQRLQVHANNFRLSVTDALADVFSIVGIFVGQAFLKAAARKFVLACPPTEPVLSQYGSGFADFLEDFQPASSVSYIADLARLEWAMHELQAAVETPVLMPDDARRLPSGAKVAVSPNVRLISSKYPIVSLWMAGRGQLPAEIVDPTQGGQAAIVRLHDGQVRLELIEPARLGNFQALMAAPVAVRDLAPDILDEFARRHFLAAQEQA